MTKGRSDWRLASSINGDRRSGGSEWASVVIDLLPSPSSANASSVKPSRYRRIFSSAELSVWSDCLA
jgi:hypothetical protein